MGVDNDIEGMNEDNRVTGEYSEWDSLSESTLGEAHSALVQNTGNTRVHDIEMGEGASPIAKGTTERGTIPAQKVSVWDKSGMGGLSYGQMIARNRELEAVKMEYFPLSVTPEGKTRIIITQDDLKASAQVYPLHLYGYFLGTSMDYNVVNRCLHRLWRSYDLAEVTKSPAGIYYFKFKSEKGLNDVLENGPWMVNNIPVFLDKWVPGLCLEKIEPSIVPMWVTVHNIPLDLWTSTGINKLMSGMGEPKLMDRLTLERCANQTGKLGYARVLVDVKAACNLPSEVEVVYPNRITTLKVSYQWKPPICSYCVVFGHNDLQCKNKPKTNIDVAMKEATDTEKAAGCPGTAIKQNIAQKDKGKGVSVTDDDGFETVMNKKNRQTQADQAKPNNRGHNSTKNNHSGGQQVSSNSGGSKMDHNANIASCSKPNSSGLKNQQHPPKQQKKAVNQAHNSAPKATGFNFAHAVQGRNAKDVSGVKIVDKSAPGTADKPMMCTYNIFSVLNVQENVKQGTLVHDNSDLYPPENTSTEKCTVNRKNVIDPGRILPTWSQFNPSESLNRILEKDYGITDAQKKRILDALRSDAKAVKAADQEEWVDGEWEFFHDKCTELDLDPDFCVEDVYEDECGSAQFMAQLAKTVLIFCVVRWSFGCISKLLLFGTFCLILYGRWVKVLCSKSRYSRWESAVWLPVFCTLLQNVSGRVYKIPAPGFLKFWSRVNLLAWGCAQGLLIWGRDYVPLAEFVSPVLAPLFLGRDQLGQVSLCVTQNSWGVDIYSIRPNYLFNSLWCMRPTYGILSKPKKTASSMIARPYIYFSKLKPSTWAAYFVAQMASLASRLLSSLVWALIIHVRPSTVARCECSLDYAFGAQFWAYDLAQSLLNYGPISVIDVVLF
ncbi:putative transcription factor interactor and regulator CCHC(Zn) family [Helianthus debilis subsp. tardiflorus]